MVWIWERDDLHRPFQISSTCTRTSVTQDHDVLVGRKTAAALHTKIYRIYDVSGFELGCLRIEGMRKYLK
jgi:hypothetical protein